MDCSLVSASKFHAVSMQTFRVRANVGNKRSPIINGHFFFNIGNSFASVHTFCIQFVLRSPVFTFWEMFQSTLYSACQSTFYNDVHSTHHNAFQSTLHNVLQSTLHNVLHWFNTPQCSSVHTVECAAKGWCSMTVLACFKQQFQSKQYDVFTSSNRSRQQVFK